MDNNVRLANYIEAVTALSQGRDILVHKKGDPISVWSIWDYKDIPPAFDAFDCFAVAHKFYRVAEMVKSDGHTYTTTADNISEAEFLEQNGAFSRWLTPMMHYLGASS